MLSRATSNLKEYRTKMKIPGDNMGYNAYFLDSEKNVMGVWSMT